MAYLIGTDEAGFGPNLGPLTVSATVWRIPPSLVDANLYDVLSPVVSANLTDEQQRIVIADSKQLYKPHGSWKHLEAGIWAYFATKHTNLPTTWQDVWNWLSPDALARMETLAWYQDVAIELPRDLDLDDFTRGQRFAEELLRRDIQLQRMETVVVLPAEFNVMVDQLGSKGRLLSHVTLQLVRRILSTLDDEPVFVVYDKHGGRNNYAPLLQELFNQSLVQVASESRAESVYRLGTPQQPVQMAFRMKGESFLPTALASMASKYLRELAMFAFNAYWQKQVPELRATAGYPQDAKRFRIDIDAAVHKLHLNESTLWRKR